MPSPRYLCRILIPTTEFYCFVIKLIQIAVPLLSLKYFTIYCKVIDLKSHDLILNEIILTEFYFPLFILCILTTSSQKGKPKILIKLQIIKKNI